MRARLQACPEGRACLKVGRYIVSFTMRLKVTKTGQMSVPAAVRRRWATSDVIAEDHGDHLIVRPAPDDAIADAYGAFAEELAGGRSIAEMRTRHRAEEAEIESSERRRYRRDERKSLGSD